MANSKDEILNKIRKAKQNGATQNLLIQLQSSEREIEVFVQPSGDLIENFARELEKISGSCFIVKNKTELTEKLRSVINEHKIGNILCMEKILEHEIVDIGVPIHSSIDNVDTSTASVTGCEFLISRTGSVMVSNANSSGRRPHVYPDVHIVFARGMQVVADLKNAMDALCEKHRDNFPSWVSVITGPSRTADIEKTLILGAHGPKKLIVFITK